ncbi:MAG: HU family DNA-binding protein [Thermodesulfobacteriota bacterium]|nr:HU family DNA-binding protein [Thermodesulfobacteriota bacterium]
MPMTKNQVVTYLAEKVGVNKKQAAALLDELAGLAAKIIKKGDKLALPGFVTVKVQNRKARIGRNPQTGEPLKIPAKKVVKVVPAAALKAILGPKKK